MSASGVSPGRSLVDGVLRASGADSPQSELMGPESFQVSQVSHHDIDLSLPSGLQDTGNRIGGAGSKRRSRSRNGSDAESQASTGKASKRMRGASSPRSTSTSQANEDDDDDEGEGNEVEEAEVANVPVFHCDLPPRCNMQQKAFNKVFRWRQHVNKSHSGQQVSEEKLEETNSEYCHFCRKIVFRTKDGVRAHKCTATAAFPSVGGAAAEAAEQEGGGGRCESAGPC